jgi:hypothetical protein
MPLSRINTNAIANGAVAVADLANTGVTAGTYGGSSNISVVTVNAQGLVTSASNSALSLNSITGELTVSGNITQNGTGFTTLAVGTTAQRPTSTANGQSRINTTSGNLEYFYNGAWKPLVAQYTVNYLVVAGGGSGGGYYYAGGGGAGGLISGSTTVVSGTQYSITVGAGGSQTNGPAGGNAGNPSIFALGTAVTALGGGRGGTGNDTSGSPAMNGGSGGGAASGYPVGTGTPGQGNNGGSSGGAPNGFSAGGGGGAGAVGSNAPGTPNVGNAGAGGVGVVTSLVPSGLATGLSIGEVSGGSVYFAGGGGGATGAIPGGYNGGAGGTGGGGKGGGYQYPAPAAYGVAGTANTGGGGGGGSHVATNDFGIGRAGGSGIVIISYAGNQQGTGGANVFYTGANTVHTFTTSGTFTA